MDETVTQREFIATRRTTRMNNSTYVVLDKRWGIKPGDLVEIKVRLIMKGGDTLQG